MTEREAEDQAETFLLSKHFKNNKQGWVLTDYM